MPWELTENKKQIRHNVRDEGDFKEGSIRTLTLPGAEGVSLIRGKLKTNNEWATLSVHFDTEQWDMDKAKAWVKDHKDKFSDEVAASFADDEAVKFPPGMSWRDREQALRDLFAAKFGKSDQPGAPSVYVQDVYDDSVIAEIGIGNQRGLYRVPYTLTEGGATFGEPVQVRRETLYVKFADNEANTLATEEYEPGRWAIRGVQIFPLGFHKGFDYTKEWADRAVSNFFGTKYRPPVIIGHTTDGGPERDAVGFLDNLRIVGDKLFADLVHLGKRTFEKIKAGSWPYRSIEVLDKAAQITALALLGGTPPYMKDAPLTFASDESGRWLVFNLPEGDVDMTPEQLKQLQDDNAALKARADAAENEARNTKAQAEAFRVQTVTQLSAAAEGLRQGRIERFTADVKALGITPAVLGSAEFKAFTDALSGDGTKVRFSAKDAAGKDVISEVPGLEAFQKFMGLVADQAKKAALIITPAGETASITDPKNIPADVRQRYGDNVDEDSLEVVAQVNALVAKGTYNHLPKPLRFAEAFKDLAKSRATA